MNYFLVMPVCVHADVAKVADQLVHALPDAAVLNPLADEKKS